MDTHPFPIPILCEFFLSVLFPQLIISPRTLVHLPRRRPAIKEQVPVDLALQENEV